MTGPAGLPRVHSGKVRELYDAGGDRLLMVASDRISAFDVVMDEPIPEKGRVLTAMTAYWLEELADLAPNHLVSADVADYPAGAGLLPDPLTAHCALVARLVLPPRLTVKVNGVVVPVAPSGCVAFAAAIASVAA